MEKENPCPGWMGISLTIHPVVTNERTWSPGAISSTWSSPYHSRFPASVTLSGCGLYLPERLRLPMALQVLWKVECVDFVAFEEENTRQGRDDR